MKKLKTIVFESFMVLLVISILSFGCSKSTPTVSTEVTQSKSNVIEDNENFKIYLVINGSDTLYVTYGGTGVSTIKK